MVAFDTFEFDNDRVFHQKVYLIFPYLTAFIIQRIGNLALVTDTLDLEFCAKSSFVGVSQ